MKRISRKMRFAAALGMVAVPIAAVWLVGAVQSGVFIAPDSRHASAPGENSTDAFSMPKKFIEVGPWQVAYIDESAGDPILRLHGCPFSAYEYSQIIPILARNHRVVASDLLGLGDTIVPVDDDYRLPNQEKMVLGLMDQLGIALVYWQQMFLAATSLRPRWSRR